MIEIGSFRSATCEGFTRRSFLRMAAAAPLGLGITSAAAQAANPEAKARSILVVWLGGGPSHLDLFDPKPKAPAEFRGPFATIPTRAPGVRFTELLPRLAGRSDRFALVRSNVNLDGGHREAGSIALTGASGVMPSGIYPPNFGSVVARHRGAGDLPPFISLARGPIGDGVGPVQGSGGGLWGQSYDPFLIGCSEAGALSIPSLKLAEGLTLARLADRRSVMQELDRVRRTADSPSFELWDHLHQKAFALLSSPATHAALDLSREPEKARAAYGHTSFGQSCLLGRRLVEAGVPYVQVNWSQFVEVFYQFSDYGWDTHADNFGLLADWHGPLLDRVLSMLIDDLRERGLLETTLLVCMGEFGRTPRINAIGSRDHWHQCYFSLWAGAGVRAGAVIGE
ncbi:MAG TPA: DUF1501 domain-containing protein, partial [Isosphaeraceae bacterium]|nr:DUF1501 domain-containing protein [Isosphaeraceae bacterium]